MSRATELKNRVVLVTGASTGIGLCLVRQLDKRGYRVVATARASSLGRFAEAGIREHDNLLIRPLDVTDVDQAHVIDEVCKLWGCIDVLVNNAGRAFYAVTEDMTLDNDREMFETNYFGPMRLIRRVLPYMRENRRGHIINISSVGGMMAMPTMGAYSASKFALEGASESLWYELKPWGIHVTLVQPGFVRSRSFLNTQYTDRSRASLSDPDAPYHRYYANLQPFIARMMNRSRSTSDSIALAIIRTMGSRRPKIRQPATYDAWAFYFLRRLLPSRLYHHVLYRGLPGIDSWVP
jgi:short-subunit dehydrogenase